jgi:hypothetical protein
MAEMEHAEAEQLLNTEHLELVHMVVMAEILVFLVIQIRLNQSDLAEVVAVEEELVEAPQIIYLQEVMEIPPWLLLQGTQ